MKSRKLIPRRFYIRYKRFRAYAFEQRYLPRWAVLGIDLGLCLFAFFITSLLMSSSPFSAYQVLNLPEKALLLFGVQALAFGIFRTYSGIIRHSTFTDVYRIALASALVLVFTLIVNQVYSSAFGSKIFLTTELLLYTFFSLIFLVSFRVTVKEGYRFLRQAANGKHRKDVIILGTDDKSIALVQSIIADWGSEYRPIAFLSGLERSNNHKIMGLPVIGGSANLPESLHDIKDRYHIDGLLIIGSNLSVKEKNLIVEAAFEQQLEVYNVSHPEQWLDKDDVRINIQPIQIEDLLERTVIETDIGLISKDLHQKSILITGGAGSIGSELVRQVAEFNPKKLIILDNAESPLHEVDLYLKKNKPDLNFSVYLADITNRPRMTKIFEKYKFDLVYHAAAYKHVPMIEKHPREGIKTNVVGTRILAELSKSNEVQRFVMVSTDKAVNPSNVMGASKRVAEMYVQSLQKEEGFKTKFITTRFGNVLGSNGSVIPLFKNQIELGGPVTVTHKDIIRYFMTIQEACQLVLQAGTMGEGGEIFVFDMGKPVRILDMAERMIKLCGLRPYVDIPIEITGLREGEKLYEELLNDGETTLPTFHPKIMVNQMVAKENKVLLALVDELEAAVNRTEPKALIIQKLKNIVPEYLSQNSIYCSLDES